jgi:hypothetical protein
LVCYSSDQISYVWDKVKDYIQSALDCGAGFPLQDVYEGLCNAEMQLWTAQSDGIDAAIVTTIQTTKEGGKGCLLLACGGKKVDDWLDQFLEVAEPWAVSQDCTEMRIYGRIGWARKTGYRINYTKMTKALR